MQPPAFQDFYPDPVAHCYGCGRLNGAGLQIKTRWEGDESVTHLHPMPERFGSVPDQPTPGERR